MHAVVTYIVSSMNNHLGGRIPRIRKIAPTMLSLAVLETLLLVESLRGLFWYCD